MRVRGMRIGNSMWEKGMRIFCSDIYISARKNVLIYPKLILTLTKILLFICWSILTQHKGKYNFYSVYIWATLPSGFHNFYLKPQLVRNRVKKIFREKFAWRHEMSMVIIMRRSQYAEVPNNYCCVLAIPWKQFRISKNDNSQLIYTSSMLK